MATVPRLDVRLDLVACQVDRLAVAVRFACASAASNKVPYEQTEQDQRHTPACRSACNSTDTAAFGSRIIDRLDCSARGVGAIVRAGHIELRVDGAVDDDIIELEIAAIDP